jgi:hypothetical protein
MRTASAAAGSLAFFAIAPGVVAGAVPAWLTGWASVSERSRPEPRHIHGRP